MATNKYPTKSYMIMVDNNCRIGWDMHGHSHLPMVGYSWKPRERKGISTLFMGGLLLYLFKQGVCHIVALPFTLKNIFRQTKNYGNSNISPCKNIIFKKFSKRNQNLSRYYNYVTNVKLQHKPKYQISKILI
jgi:hypothetical protein